MKYNVLDFSNTRIDALDLLRGIAIIGILIMNIISFSNVGLGYVNPYAGAGLEGYNAWVHGFSFVFADMRFIIIFSILFGAGMIIFSRNAEIKNRPVNKLHYKRMFFLAIFGFVHAYLIWMGDILVTYALCGCLVYLIRKWSIRTLAILCVLLFFIPVVMNFMLYYMTPQDVLQDMYSWWTPDQSRTSSEINAYRGSYLDQMSPRIMGAIELQTIIFITQKLWHVSAMMILGMILLRKGYLSASWPFSKYRNYFLSLFAIGLVVAFFGLSESYRLDWEGIWSMNIGSQYVYFSSLFMALSYIALVMMWSQKKWLSGLKLRLQAVGKMALTNYILTSVLCTFIFYGHGLGLFAKLDRLQCWGIIFLVWMILIYLSPLVLSKYRQGPLESLWRRLTYS